MVRRGDRLVLVNTVRLNDDGLAALDRLGKVGFMAAQHRAELYRPAIERLAPTW